MAFSPLHFEYGIHIQVGKDCFCNFNCSFLDVSPITLGDGVMIGPNVLLVTPLHPLLANERIVNDYPTGRYNLEYSKPITIGNGCWIASGATICGGVTIGENSVVAAGSVVTKDMPKNSLIAGVPARVIRELTDDDKMNVWETYLKEEIPLSVRDKKVKNYL